MRGHRVSRPNRVPERHGPRCGSQGHSTCNHPQRQPQPETNDLRKHHHVDETAKPTREPRCDAATVRPLIAPTSRGGMPHPTPAASRPRVRAQCKRDNGTSACSITVAQATAAARSNEAPTSYQYAPVFSWMSQRPAAPPQRAACSERRAMPPRHLGTAQRKEEPGHSAAAQSAAPAHPPAVANRLYEKHYHYY